MQVIPLNLAVEDPLSESVIQRILGESAQKYATRTIYNNGGYGYLKRVVRGFNHAAKGTPFLILTDLDTCECPATLIADWLRIPRHPNLLFRVAVTEVEAWLLADREGIAAFLGVSVDLVPLDVQRLRDPKGVLVGLACRSRKRDIKRDLCPGKNSTRKVGPNYNAQLGMFVQQQWNIDRAATNAESLQRLINRLGAFTPTSAQPNDG